MPEKIAEDFPGIMTENAHAGNVWKCWAIKLLIRGSLVRFPPRSPIKTMAYITQREFRVRGSCLSGNKWGNSVAIWDCPGITSPNQRADVQRPAQGGPAGGVSEGSGRERCDARRPSTGRSIRAGGVSCTGQSARGSWSFGPTCFALPKQPRMGAVWGERTGRPPAQILGHISRGASH
jgi:hypothetical protein